MCFRADWKNFFFMKVISVSGFPSESASLDPIPSNIFLPSYSKSAYLVVEPLTFKVRLVKPDAACRLHANSGKGLHAETARRLRLDRSEPKTAGQKDRPPDQVRGHPLTPALHLNTDHPDGEHLVRSNLLVNMTVLPPQSVVDRLDRPIAFLNPVQRLLHRHLHLVFAAGVVHSNTHWFTLVIVSQQGEVFYQDPLNLLVHVPHAVEPLAEAKVFGEGFIIVVGGIQQPVHSFKMRGTHNRKAESLGSVLKKGYL